MADAHSDGKQQAADQLPVSSPAGDQRNGSFAPPAAQQQQSNVHPVSRGSPVFRPPPPPNFAQFRPPPPPDIAASSPRQGNQPFSEIPISPARGPPSEFGSANGQVQPHSVDLASSYVSFTSRTIIHEKNLANLPSLPFGAIVSPYRELEPAPPAVNRKPHRCQDCGAYPTPYAKLAPASGQWMCVICRKINSSGGDFRPANNEDLLNWPELVSPVVDYIDAGSWRPGFVPVADSAVSPPVVLVVDNSIDESLLQHLQSSLHSFLDSLASTTRIGIITYGKSVSIYDLSESGLASADVLQGAVSPSQELLKTLIYGTGIYLAPVHSCLQVAHAIVSSLRPYVGDLREPARPRCLGTSVEVALALVQGPSSGNMVRRSGGSSRILVCAAGPNTLGPGSLPQNDNHPNYAYMEAQAVTYMNRLGRDARYSDTTVDIFAAGTCPVRVAALEPLAKSSGGMMVLHDDFGEAFDLNLRRSLNRAAGYRGILEVRCSDGIGISSVIGAGQEASLDESFKQEPALVLRMPTVGTYQGFAMTMQLTSDLQSQYAYFQFVSRYTSIFQARITGVITVRLPVSGSIPKYLQSVDTSIAALLIAKKTVLEAKTMLDAAELRFSADERLKDIAKKLGPPLPRSRSRLFPREISTLPEILFHLRRGPLLGGIVGHEDERLVLRSIFLQASEDLALRMMLPRLFMYHEGGSFEEVPPYNLAMQSDTALVLDHGTDIFTWLGAELCQDEQRTATAFAACKRLVQEITESRFPTARVLCFKEGTSQARYLQSRLLPAHDDPTYEQEAKFPQLRTLGADQRARLKIKFVRTDEPSLSVWMKGLKLTNH